MLVSFSHFDKMQTNYGCGSQFLNWVGGAVWIFQNFRES